MPQPLPPYFTVRVLDGDFGTVITDDLPHLHQITFTQKGFQSGAPASNMIGDFKIALFPPNDDQNWGKYAQVYSQLAYGQRVEITPIYDDVGATSYLFGGTGEQFTGVITDITKSFDSFEISGKDSLWWLQQSLSFNGETLVQDAANYFWDYLGTNEVVYDDDFSAGNLSAYTIGEVNKFSWDVGSAATLNLPAVKYLTPTDTSSYTGVIYTNGTYDASFWDMSAETTAQFFVFPNTSTSEAASLGVVINLSDANNFWLGRAELKTDVANSTGHIDAEIWTKTAGTYTLRASLANAFSSVDFSSTPLIIEVSLVAFMRGFAGLCLALSINGKYCCEWVTWGDLGTVTIPTSHVGLRMGVGPQTSSQAAAMYCTRFTTRNRSVTSGTSLGGSTGKAWPRFTSYLVFPGSLPTPPSIFNFIANGQPHLDIMGQMADTCGAIITKRAGMMYRGYTPSVTGSDGDRVEMIDPALVRSNVFFKEGEDLLDLKLTANAETFGRDVRVAATTSSAEGSSGVFSWKRVLQQRQIALTDTVINTRSQDIATIIEFGKAVSDNKSLATGGAAAATILRTADNAATFNAGDVIQITSPTMGIFNKMYRVMGITYNEGDPVIEVLLSQFPADTSEFDQFRLRSSQKLIASTFAKR